MKRAFLVVLAVVLLLSIPGCSGKITSGEIVEKNFTHSQLPPCFFAV